MAMASTLAYYDTATITAVKGFIVEAPEMSQSYISKESNMSVRAMDQSYKNFFGSNLYHPIVS